MTIKGSTIQFRFKGKSNKRLSYTIDDKMLADNLKLLLRLEGDKIFQYIDENNKIKGVTDMDLNRYIQKYMGSEYTVKDFRTYAANYYFIKALLKATNKRSPKNERAIKKNLLEALKSTSFYLKHTRSISKKSYVLDFAIELYRENPDYYIKRKDEEPEDLLLDILNMYRKKILKI